MNKKRLKRIIDELKKLPDTTIELNSISEPVCGTPGCFAGLISLIINEIPEMKKIYNKDYKNKKYSYVYYANIFCKYLGFNNKQDFYNWHLTNPKIWGEGYNQSRFSYGNAWGTKKKYFHMKLL